MWIRSLAETIFFKAASPALHGHARDRAVDKSSPASISCRMRCFLKQSLIALVTAGICLAATLPAWCEEQPEDHLMFVSGFNAYQQKDFSASALKLNELLLKYPDTPLRDVALFWLSRSYYKSGQQTEASRFMATFISEYPDSMLRGMVDDDSEKRPVASLARVQTR